MAIIVFTKMRNHQLLLSNLCVAPIVVVLASLFGLSLALSAPTRAKAGESIRNDGFKWADAFFEYPYRLPSETGPALQIVTQEYQPAQKNQSAFKTKLSIGGKPFEHGIGVHAESYIRIKSDKPLATLSAWIGIDDATSRLGSNRGNVIFSVRALGREIYRSPAVRSGGPAININIPLNGATLVELRVVNHYENPKMNYADWAEAAIATETGGETTRLDQLRWGEIAYQPSDYPFSFVYGGKSSNQLLPKWTHETKTTRVDPTKETLTETWSEPGGPLTVRMEATRYDDYPAVEWLLYFENRGERDTDIVENIHSMDIVVAPGIQTPEKRYFRLTKTDGDRTQPEQFLPSVVDINQGEEQTLSAGGYGRSSQKDLPFYKIEYEGGAMIAAVGWTGEWESVMETPDGSHLHLVAGLERTHFRLHPQEVVRLARMLVLDWHGDSLEANAQFRELLYKHYVRRLAGEKMLPQIFAHSGFSGMSFNDSTAAQYVAAIEAYSKIKGVQGFLTDTGWYEGGYNRGDGNYMLVNRKLFPDGIEAVAAEAKRSGLPYGLWFDVEMNSKGTSLIRSHPEWFLSPPSGKDPSLNQAMNPDQDPGQYLDPNRYLLNFGLSDARQAQLATVEHYLDMPGFGLYKQDFNGYPFPYWSKNDAVDRQGITEIKYIMGLYEYWDELVKRHPDFVLEGCSSGGKRIDLETITRLNIAIKSDLAGNHETDQTGIMGLSQYVPNSFPSAPLTTLDDYGFYSSMPASIELGWRAYLPNFDFARANVLVQRFLRVRELLVGAWYPLLPATLDKTLWVGSEYYRRDLARGLFLVFRRENSPYTMVEVKAHGLEADARYELVTETSKVTQEMTGRRLMDGFTITLAQPRSAEMIMFRKVN
jgi:alpha-galactosidase